MTFKFDDAKFEAAVRGIAAANPDHVYKVKARDDVPGANPNSCFYAHTDGKGGWEAGCLIGQALVASGVDIEELARIDRGDGETATDAYAVLTHFGASDHIAMWANYVQHRQDYSVPW